jgi:maleate isomerase
VGLSFDTDRGMGARATLGVIVLQTDETLENELRQVFRDPAIALYHARIRSDPLVTKETLARMAKDLPEAARLLPKTLSFDAIGYACTSGATVIGRQAVAAMVRAHHPGVPVTDPITAVVAGCAALRVEKLGFLSPYVPEVSRAMRDLLEDEGFRITGFGSFEQVEDQVVARISEASTLNAIVEIGASPDCDAVFVSCTNLRTFGILAQAEETLGKPVVSSNQAIAWHLLRLAGVGEGVLGPGRLFEV